MSKRRKVLLGTAIVFLALVLLLSFLVFFKKDKVEYISVELKKQDLLQTVNEVGAVKASKELDLNFLQMGRLSDLFVEIGDQVEEGQILAELDHSALLIRKEEASAALNIAQANLDKINRGATIEEIRIAEAQVAQAEVNYEAAQEDLLQTERKNQENLVQAEKNLDDLKLSNAEMPMSIKQAIDSARLNLENSRKSLQQNINSSQNSFANSLSHNLSQARTALDAIKRVIDDSDLKGVFSVRDYAHRLRTENSYLEAVSLISDVEDSINFFKANKNLDLAQNSFESLDDFLNKVFASLNFTFTALEHTITSSDLSQSALDSFKASINSQIGIISGALSSNHSAFSALDNAYLSYETGISNAQDLLNKAEVALSDAILSAENNLALLRISNEQILLAAQNKLESARKSYDLAELQLNKLKSPARSEDLRLVRAQVEQAESSLESLNNQIEEHKLKAPIKGQIVKINYETGEQISGALPMINLLTENDFEIELLVSESDISKLKIGNQAEIDFDAFDSKYKAQGELYFIEPAATNISGVIYYKTKVIFSAENFIKDNLEIKSGMTANVSIISNKKEDTLVIPFRAIVNEGDRHFLRVLTGPRQFKEVEISLGLSGDQALVEVFSNELKEGDKVITSIKNSK